LVLLCLYFFFFHAEDGIRDRNVTGVQTCALPIYPLECGVVLPSARTVEVAAEAPGVEAESFARTAPSAWAMADPARARRGEEPRSEERRGGKGWRWRGAV